MTSSKSLLQELWDHISEALHHDRDALRACSLTCRAWRSSCQHHLFREVSLLSDERRKLLSDIVDSSPYILQYVTKVWMLASLAARQAEPSIIYFPRVKEVAVRLTDSNGSGYTYGGQDPSLLARYLSSSCPRLESLAFEDGQLSPISLLHTLTSLPQLRRIRIGMDVSTPNDWHEADFVYPRNAPVLDISDIHMEHKNHRPGLAPIFDVLSHLCSIGSLRPSRLYWSQLFLRRDEVAAFSRLTRLCPNLRALHLSFAQFRAPGDGTGRPREILDLSRNPDLRSICATIEVGMRSSLRTAALDIADLQRAAETASVSTIVRFEIMFLVHTLTPRQDDEDGWERLAQSLVRLSEVVRLTRIAARIEDDYSGDPKWGYHMDMELCMLRIKSVAEEHLTPFRERIPELEVHVEIHD